MAAATIITTGWTVGELKRVADQIKSVLEDKHDTRVVTLTIAGNTVSTSTKHTMTLAVNGVDYILQG